MVSQIILETIIFLVFWAFFLASSSGLAIVTALVFFALTASGSGGQFIVPL